MAAGEDPQIDHASLMEALQGTRREVRVVVGDVNGLKVSHASLLEALAGTRRTVGAHTQEIARVDRKVEDYNGENNRVANGLIESMSEQRQDINRIDGSIKDIVAPTVDQVVANPRLVAGLGEHFTTVGEFERWKKSSGAGPINWMVGAVALVVLVILSLVYGPRLAIALHGPHYQSWVITILIAASVMLAVGIMFLASSAGGDSGESVLQRTTTTETADQRPQPTPVVASTEVIPAVAPATTSPSPRVMV